MKVYLIRHGRSASNESVGTVLGRCNESPLVALGVRQAREVGHAMAWAGIRPDRVFSSPALRALATARLASAAAGFTVAVEIDDRLQEQDVGRWVGLPGVEVFDDACLAEIQRLGLDFRPPGGESMSDVGRRMFDWIESLQDGQTSGSEVVVAFSHGGAIRALASRLLGWTHARTYAEKPANGSVTLLALDEVSREWSVRFVGAPCGELAGGR